MRRAIALLVFAVAALVAIPRAEASQNKLWIAWDGGLESCKTEVVNLFDCAFTETNWDTLALQYPNAKTLTIAGTAVVNGCTDTGWTCIVNAAGFAINDGDVLLHYHGASCTTGHNYVDVPVNGKNIHAAEVNSGSSCNCQTALGSHEIWEASTDQAAADCCNGQQWAPLSPSCAQYGAPGYGWYSLSCGGNNYEVQLLGKKDNEFTAAGCTKLSIGCPGGGKVVDTACTKDSDCCSGLVCEKWSYSGKAPYSDYCCKAVGQTCSLNTDCCGGSNCDNGKCGCVATGQWCINDNDCCGGDTCDLAATKCVTAPPGTTSTSVATSVSTGAGGAGGTGGEGGAKGVGGSLSSTASGGLGGSGGGMGGAVTVVSPVPDEDGGCGCRVASEGSTRAGWAMLALALLALRRRRGGRDEARV